MSFEFYNDEASYVSKTEISDTAKEMISNRTFKA
jgi:hypothetical protein